MGVKDNNFGGQFARNLKDPEQLQDGVTKNYSDKNLQDAKDYADGIVPTGSIPFIHLGMATNQTVSTGDTLAFGTTRSSNVMTKSNNGIDLEAGKTYKLMAWVNLRNAAGNAFLGYMFYVYGGAAISGSAYTQAGSMTAGYGFKAPLIMFYTPSVDETIVVKVSDDNISTGEVADGFNTSFTAEEITGVKGDTGETGATGPTGPAGGDLSIADIYPVGCIFTEITGTNPATMLGFGTWVAFGAGKVLVGLDSGDTDIDTAEEEYGEKTHTLLEAEMPSHTHIQNSHKHTGNSQINYGITGAYGYEDANGRFNVASLQALMDNATATNQDAGSDDAHNNMQPSIVVHFWKRTA